jgi:hypothetical protein
MYATKTGFHLLIGSDWHGEVPKGITQVFRSSSNTGIVATRVLQDGTPEDQRVVQAPLAGVMIYPLAEYDGKMKTIGWSKIPHHFFVATVINRFSVGTKNKDLKLAGDGSLTIYVQEDEPKDPAQRANWLPAPKGDFSPFIRAYWPKPQAIDGTWLPQQRRKRNDAKVLQLPRRSA